MKKYNIRINYIDFKNNQTIIGWSAKNIGFGVLTITYDKEKDIYYVETETMGKDFYEQVIKEAKKYLFHKSVIIE